jgi:hypothetical protein
MALVNFHERVAILSVLHKFFPIETSHAWGGKSPTVYSMGKNCGRLVVTCNTANISAGHHFASAFNTMNEIAPVYFGQIMDRSWVYYEPTMDRLLIGGDFLPPPPFYPCSR